MRIKSFIALALAISMSFPLSVFADWGVRLSGGSRLDSVYDTDADRIKFSGYSAVPISTGGVISPVRISNSENLFFSNVDVSKKDYNITYFKRGDEEKTLYGSKYYMITFYRGFFKDMPKLKYTDFGTYPVTIYRRCFVNCPSLKSIRLGQTDCYEAHIYNGPDAGEQWTSRSNYSSIYPYAFVDCPNLDTVIIDGKDTYLWDNAFINCGDITIYCLEGSKALDYAKRFNYKYVIMADPDVAFGDADLDGYLTASDASAVIQKVLNPSYEMPIEKVYPNYMDYLDVDKSGVLDASDSTYIMQKVLVSTYIMPIEIKN